MTYSISDSFKMFRIAPVIWVRDIHTMIDFYAKQLGFSNTWLQGDCQKPVYAIVSMASAEIHFSPKKPQLAGCASFHVLMADLNAYWNMVRLGKVDIVKTIGNRDYQMRDFMIRDPEGNLIEFGENL